jgi:hypothetical protein
MAGFLSLHGVGASSGGSTLLLKDSFVDTNGTGLASHTMDVGPGWTVNDGGWTIQGNKAAVQTVSGYGTAVSQSGQSNVTGNVTVNLSANSRMGFAARVSDDSDFWRVVVSVNAGALEILEVVSGVQTVRASSSLTISQGVNYALQAQFAGQTVTATVNGGNQISYNSAASNQSVTKHGLTAGANSNGTASNFQVTNP